MASPHDPLNDPRPGDLDNNLLRKILSRLGEGVLTVSPQVVIQPGDVQIGAVALKDGVGEALSSVTNTTPAANAEGLVTRNIPSGTQTVAGTVDVGNFPASINVGNLPATQPVSGTVAVSNLPATQTVDGTVNVGNFPATQPVSGTVGVSNFPATQPVSGTVGVNNFPATQPISGTVSVTGTVGVTNVTDISNPQFDAVRLGAVFGKTAYSFHVMGRRAGFNSTSVLQDVGEWLGTSIDALPELTGAENLEVISSSANDTAAGTGTRTIRVGYIDTSNNLVVSSDITLNGTTAVALAFKANFILWMESTTSGSLGVSAGNISLRIAGAGATQEYISAGGNRSLTGRFMIPTGYTGYLVDWAVWAIATTQDARLRATVRTFSRTLGTVYVFQSVAYVGSGASSSEEMHYAKLPALSKVKVSTIPGAAANTNRIDVEFTLLLVAD